MYAAAADTEAEFATVILALDTNTGRAADSGTYDDAGQKRVSWTD